jgi:hypothetical protein
VVTTTACRRQYRHAEHEGTQSNWARPTLPHAHSSRSLPGDAGIGASPEHLLAAAFAANEIRERLQVALVALVGT